MCADDSGISEPPLWKLNLQRKNLIMTVGAASGLNVIFKTILNPEEEVIVFAPYFLEYGAYVQF